ncbi:MAG: hypothetical protein HXY23_04370 [Parvularculaceae bacterium]|nr:hypothetical protein [Parvularculaceae bacterium]
MSEREREALLRAAAAFLLADDRAGFLSLRAEASARFGAFPEKELIGVMNLEDGDSGAKFLDAYRQLYSKS